MALSMAEQMTHFDSLSHEEKYKEVKNMTRIIGDAGGDLNGLDTTLETFGEYATDEDLKTIYESLLSLIKDYQDQR